MQLKSAVTLCELAPRPSLHGPSQRHTVRCSATYLWLFVSCLPTLYAVFIATMLVWSCSSSATASPTMRTHASPPAAGAAPPRHYLPTTLTPHRYQRTRRHLATTLQLYGRWCARPTAMWQDRLAMWPPVMMVNSSKLDEPSMQARKPGHRASLRRHRTHTVVRSHQYDTLRPYARRLRGRVFKRSPPYFSLFRCDPLSAKTICPSGNCSPMAFWLWQVHELHVSEKSFAVWSETQARDFTPFQLVGSRQYHPRVCICPIQPNPSWAEPWHRKMQSPSREQAPLHPKDMGWLGTTTRSRSSSTRSWRRALCARC